MTKADRIRELKAQGLGVSAIAEIVGCTPQYAWSAANYKLKSEEELAASHKRRGRKQRAFWALHKEAAARRAQNALEGRKRAVARRKALPLAEQGPSAKAASLYLRGEKSMTEAAAECGVTTSAVSWYITRNKLRETAAMAEKRGLE